ncbi:hypothetical protein NEUTE1DRAFT_108011 [Neurospora tetrasperma FGSC 2508]|uniref:Uncharacterized protein n=1 Tax=Neurospora tetrasperma (strain FGSC 2508 / ATCC MYA-4615 / P0657) TaxID=510951 RepID=F8ME18_NEUT8|nr:uncharacterized protein NEUTE1DRAFT_108011 [Neurospora tetrasperma FGSC 2508]EGO61553.1 hypothetical protein NEUTE1DRAFT_108011 [Neurospora tetrasperma FGSC 2508]
MIALFLIYSIEGDKQMLEIPTESFGDFLIRSNVFFLLKSACVWGELLLTVLAAVFRSFLSMARMARDSSFRLDLSPQGLAAIHGQKLRGFRSHFMLRELIDDCHGSMIPKSQSDPPTRYFRALVNIFHSLGSSLTVQQILQFSRFHLAATQPLGTCPSSSGQHKQHFGTCSSSPFDRQKLDLEKKDPCQSETKPLCLPLQSLRYQLTSIAANSKVFAGTRLLRCSPTLSVNEGIAQGLQQELGKLTLNPCSTLATSTFTTAWLIHDETSSQTQGFLD